MRLSSLVLASILLTPANASHPIRALFYQLTKCENVRFVATGPTISRRSAWRDQSALLNTGTLERINPGTPQFEDYRAHYDPINHIVLIDQVGNEYGDIVYAVSTVPQAFARADLSNALPISGLHLGESREEVEKDFGPGLRRDACGLQQYYYMLDTPYKGNNLTAAFILTFRDGRLVKFILPSLAG